MNKIIKSRWFLLVFWIVIAVILKMTLPNMEQLSLEKGQATIPSNYSSQVGKNLMKQLDNEKKDSNNSTILIVFHSNKALTSQQMDNIRSGVDNLKKDENKLNITDIVTHFDNSDIEDQVVSKDKTTVLVGLNVDKNNKSINAIRDTIESELSSVSVKHYLTGSDLIISDYTKTMGEGTKKTEMFTYIVIFTILLLVFRSPVTPIISLLTIGITFICSLGIVSQLVDKFNFPYSSMTQTFLILVLFGIGTDYNILLLMRFKEELKDKSVNDAIITTYKTAGKTVLFSSLTVLIGFTALSFAKFSIYRATSAVAIAVCVLLVELTTLLPFFMKVLGPKLFWPSNVSAGHKRSNLWEKASSVSVKHPVISLIVILLLTTPIMLLFKNNLSYNTLNEVDKSFDSVKGVNIASDKFGKGKTFPVNIVIKNNTAMDNNETLSNIDEISSSITKVSGVESVYSVTRPKGDIIEDLYVNNQTKKVSDGISSSNNGIDEISNGLNTANNQLPNSMNTNNIDKLITGTSTLQNSLSQVTAALSKVNDGIKAGSQGAGNLSEGLGELKTSVDKLNASTNKLSDSYKTLQSSFSELGNNYKTVETQISLIETNLNNIDGYAKALAKNHPELKGDQSYIALTKTTAGLTVQVRKLKQGLAVLNTNYEKALTAFNQANNGLSQVSNGQTQIDTGIEKLKSGSDALASGLSQGSAGQTKIINNMPKFDDGLSKINDGQIQIKNGLDELNKSFPELKDGLTKSTSGLNQVSDGLNTANDYLSKLSSDNSSKSFYIPEDKLKGEDFKKSIDNYLSDDRKITKMTVYLSIDPYSEEAIGVVNNIENTVKAKVKGTNLENASIGIDGTSSQNRDLNLVSTEDLSRSKIIMLIGIAIVLILITRSLLTPLYIIASLLISYYASMSITQFIFKNVFHRGDLSWAVPFFVFIMLIALGVDYSIFLVSRFNEYRDINPRKAIIEAAANIGGVIMTAAIILSGTFAAMYPANINTLIELATAVIIGLFLLSFVFMPMFIPALISLTTKVEKNQNSTEKYLEKEA